MSEFDFETAAGLPGPLPVGERLLWQGAPRAWAFACSAFHARGLMVYFAVLVAVQVLGVAQAGGGLSAAAGAAAWMVVLASVALGVALGAGALYARTTTYTITDRRIVLRFGVAVPLAVNLPFSAIVAADARRRADGGCDIALTLTRAQRVGIVQMWPCVQAWRFAAPRPLLRAVPPGVAETLGRALEASVGAVVADSAPAAHASLPVGVAA